MICILPNEIIAIIFTIKNDKVNSFLSIASRIIFLSAFPYEPIDELAKETTSRVCISLDKFRSFESEVD